MRELWKKAIDAIRRAPVAKWIRPLWQGALQDVVKKGFAWLRAEAIKLEKKSPGALKALVAAWADKCKGWIRPLPLPESFEDKCCAWVDNETAELNKKVDQAGDSDVALQMLLAAIDSSERIILKRIEEL